ncbi:MAG: exo-alpha-sialidase [Verrucomicrobiales bacterium]|nr:exo-alpha-sialidase [Verrucomicrobiales bacterium]
MKASLGPRRLGLVLVALSASFARSGVPDPRHIANGRLIPGEAYCDQPYLAKTADGAWLCVMTTASGVEGSSTQHVIALRSTDRGQTWSAPVRLEPAGGPENSYAVLLPTPGGRIYCFYNFNAENLREVRTETGGVFQRVDSLGDYVFRYTDDGGRTWSDRRFTVPVREFACDRENVYGGRVRFFWNVGRPLVAGNTAWLTLHKVGAMGAGFFAQSEGAILRSDNILTEPQADRIRFETLPDGDLGLRAPPGGGRIAEEQSLTRLSDGSLFCVYRSVDGHPVCSYSRDEGHHWSTPEYLAYGPDKRRFRHPRAANFVWRCANGRFLYWFHNHGGRGYEDRNPAWLSAGREVMASDGLRLAWTEPEIALYDDDPFVRISYPDLLEEAGRFFVTETQKHVGRVHELDPGLIAGMFAQHTNGVVAAAGLLVEARAPAASVPLPRLPVFIERDAGRPDFGQRDNRAGITIEAWFRLASLTAGQTLLSNRAPDGRGFALTTVAGGTLEFRFSDGRTAGSWQSDPGLLEAGRQHHVAVILDGGPKLVLLVVDGRLGDGGTSRQFGWGRFSPNLRGLDGSAALRIAPDLEGEVRLARVYGRALRTSEAVGNWRAGIGAVPTGHPVRNP